MTNRADALECTIRCLREETACAGSPKRPAVETRKRLVEVIRQKELGPSYRAKTFTEKVHSESGRLEAPPPQKKQK